MLANKLMSALSGGDEEKLYVDDVFSTYLYTGNGSTQTINNGIDLAGKGGMVWIKARSHDGNHALYDTARGASNAISSSLTNAQYADNSLTVFGNSGFTTTYGSTYTYASWTFRKSPRFFDVVTYTGNGASSRAISHSLGQEVGMVMTKATSTTGDWNTYHRSATGDLVLNTTAAQTGSKALVNSTTTTTFTVSGAANTNGVTYVAYLFAHDTSADGIIQCGSFTVDAGGKPNAPIALGWEPQYFLTKSSSNTSEWVIVDSMRGWPATGKPPYPQGLNANASAVEGNTQRARPIATGVGNTEPMSDASATYIYLAIRRPNKPPTTGTEVYNAVTRIGTNLVPWKASGAGFPPDMSIMSRRDGLSSYQHGVIDRLRRATEHIQTVSTNGEGGGWGEGHIHNMDGYDGIYSGDSAYFNVKSTNYVDFHFRRAPGFFDVVCYTGTGVARTVAHSLGVAPELMIVKSRSTSGDWYVYASTLGAGYVTLMNSTDTVYGPTQPHWNNTTPVSSVFSLGPTIGVNQSGATHVAYLFASLPGISKVGSYTGNGTTQTINCGFATGARFILIKRTDSTGDWYIWDAARGIVSANDPHLSLNTDVAEVTTDDSVDPDASGFIVNQVAATNINVSGGQYIFLAIA